MLGSMEQVKRWAQRYTPEILLVFVAGGFLVFFLELLLLKHTEGIQLLAILASLGGLALALLSLVLRGQVLRWGMLAFALLAAVGLIGMVQHLEKGTGEALAKPLLFADTEEAYGATLESENDPAPPPLAPLGLSGLGLLGAFALLLREDAGELTIRG